MFLPTVLILISLVFAIPTSIGVTISNSLTDTCPDTDPLACILYSKSITIPEIDLDIDGTPLVISNFICSKFIIKDILSKYLYFTNFFTGADGVGTTCSGHYTYGRMKGDMTAVISKTNLNVTMDITKTKEYPSGIQLTQCAIPSMAISLTFSSAGLDALAPIIAKMLQSFFETIICTGLKTVLEGTLTDAINQKIDPMLSHIVASQSSPLPTQYGPHFINWNSSIISTIHNIFSIQHIPKLENLFQFLQCASSPPPVTLSTTSSQVEEDRSARLLEDSSSSVSSSSVISAEHLEPARKKKTKPAVEMSSTTRAYQDILTSSSSSSSSSANPSQSKQWEELVDQIEYFLSHPHLIDFTNYLDITKRTLYSTPQIQVALSYLKIVNVKQPHGIKLLEPMLESKVSLKTSFQCSQLHIQIGFDVLTNNASTITSYYLDLQLEDVIFEVDVNVAIDQHLLSSYFLDQILLQDKFACIWSSIQEISIPNFLLTNRLTVLQLILTSTNNPDRRLEADIVKLFDEFSKLLVAPFGFQTLTNEVVTGVLQGPLRHTINAFFAALIAGKHKLSPCLSHYPYDDVKEYISWSENTLFMKAITLINDYWGVNKVNQVMNCATNSTGMLTIDLSTMLTMLEASNVFMDAGGAGSSTTAKSTNALTLDYSKLTIRNKEDSPDSAVPLLFSNSLLSASSDSTTTTSSDSNNDYELVISGLNSFYAFELLLPVIDPADSNSIYQLTNNLGMGSCEDSTNKNMCNPLKFTLQKKSSVGSSANVISNVELSPKRGGMLRTLRSLAQSAAALTAASSTTTATPALSMSLSFQNLAYFTNFLMKLNMASVYDLEGKDLYASSGCGLSTVDQLSYLTRMVNVSGTVLTISTPNLGTHTSTDVDISTIMNMILSQLMATQKVIDLENNHWEDRLYNATATCPATKAQVVPAPSPTPTPDPSNSNDGNEDTTYYWAWAVAGGGIGAIIMSGIYYWLYRYYNTDKLGDATEEQSPEDSNNQILYTSPIFGPVYNPFYVTTSWSTATHGHPRDYALLYHPRLSLAFRLLVPIAILGNVALFIDSNMLADAVSVMVDVNIGSKVISLGSIFDFGLGNTVQDMWDAKVYALAVLIIFFSGLWPYIKLISMLTCWCIPIQYLSLPTRETILVIVDAAGKWSLIDFFVMVLMLCSFYCELTITPQLIVTVTVHPKWGFYSFVLATVISLALGHLIVAYHRYVTEPPSSSLLTSIIHADEESVGGVGRTHKLTLSNTIYIFYWDEDLFEPLSSQQTVGASGDAAAATTSSTMAVTSNKASPTNTAGGGKRRMFVQYTWLGYLLFHTILLFTLSIFVLGTYWNTIGFEFKGLMGLLLRDASEIEYSIWSVGLAIPSHSGMPNDFAILWTQAMYYIFTIAMPATLLLCVLILWNVPLPFAYQRKMLVFTEIINAWASLDVFCVATAASLLEIEQFAQFIVGDSCDGINNYLTKPVLDMLLEGDDVCFDVVAYLTNNCWMLFVPATGLFLVSTITLLTAEYMVMQRVHPDYLLQDIHQNHSTSFSSSINGNQQVSEEMIMPLLSPIAEEELPPMLLPEEHHQIYSSSGHRHGSEDHLTGDTIAALHAVSANSTSPLMHFRRMKKPNNTHTNNNNQSNNNNNPNTSTPTNTATNANANHHHGCSMNHAGTHSHTISHQLKHTSTWKTWYQAQSWQKIRYNLIEGLLYLQIFRLVSEEQFSTSSSALALLSSIPPSCNNSYQIRSSSYSLSHSHSYGHNGGQQGMIMPIQSVNGVQEHVPGTPLAFYPNPMKQSTVLTPYRNEGEGERKETNTMVVDVVMDGNSHSSNIDKDMMLKTSFSDF